MKDISKTTLTGILMLMILAACLVLLITGKANVQETLLYFGLLTTSIISAVGHFYAADSNQPVTLSQTTLETTGDGKQQVTVETEVPALKMDAGTKKKVTKGNI